LGWRAQPVRPLGQAGGPGDEEGPIGTAGHERV
jgi:hypothetical protein